MSNSHTQSIWKQTLAIAAIMPKLFLREKVGFGLLLAIFTLWQLLLELGILDALEDSVPINIVFTMLITIVVTCFMTAVQRRIHQPATFTSIWRAFQLGWAELIYAIVSFVIIMIFSYVPLGIVITYQHWNQYLEFDIFSYGMLLPFAIPFLLVGAGAMAIQLPRLANGVFASLSDTINATKKYRFALGVHWSVQFLLAMSFLTYVYIVQVAYPDIARPETIETMTPFILSLVAILQQIHIVLLSSASAFYIFADDPNGLRHPQLKAEDPA
tara:strand:+ start:10428 stop:11240 length:813 start_codon:yes stop_codon:yes gene_type:complete